MAPGTPFRFNSNRYVDFRKDEDYKRSLRLLIDDLLDIAACNHFWRLISDNRYDLHHLGMVSL
jgi:hypothetical protein